jgi:hypothetical protein
MSRWAVVAAGLVAVGFLSLPLLLVQASRSGRMARWDDLERQSRWAQEHQRTIWALRFAPRVFITATFLCVTVLFVLRHEFVNALIAAIFLAFEIGILALLVRAYLNSRWSSRPSPPGRPRSTDR